MADDDPRDVLRSIAYGSDRRIAPGDRVRAIERLAELEADDRRGTSFAELSPEQALEEAQSLADAMPGILACARVAAGEDLDGAVTAPEPEDEVREALDLAVEITDLQAARIAELESALAYEHRHRLLPAAQEPLECPRD